MGGSEETFGALRDPVGTQRIVDTTVFQISAARSGIDQYCAVVGHDHRHRRSFLPDSQARGWVIRALRTVGKLRYISEFHLVVDESWVGNAANFAKMRVGEEAARLPQPSRARHPYPLCRR